MSTHLAQQATASVTVPTLTQHQVDSHERSRETDDQMLNIVVECVQALQAREASIAIDSPATHTTPSNQIERTRVTLEESPTQLSVEQLQQSSRVQMDEHAPRDPEQANSSSHTPRNFLSRIRQSSAIKLIKASAKKLGLSTSDSTSEQQSHHVESEQLQIQADREPEEC